LQRIVSVSAIFLNRIVSHYTTYFVGSLKRGRKGCIYQTRVRKEKGILKTCPASTST
jgi:hypothetical protein